MNPSKILITGATGFIGRRVLSFAKLQGHYVRLLARSKVADEETILCDLSKEDSIPPHALHGIDSVFHLAGLAHELRDDSSVEDIYRSVNVEATNRLGELAAQNGVASFVFVSSIKAGGSAIDDHCMTEVDQAEPDGIYGKTKREAELRLLEIGEQSGINVSIVRPTLVYGPTVKGNLRAMLALLEKGRFPPLPDVRNRRSMIHVDDLVQAIFLLHNNRQSIGQIFIAADGMAYSSREIYKQLCYSLGKSPASWAVPKFVFDLLGMINSGMKQKFDKLFCDAYYSSEKLRAIGFRPKQTLSQINENLF